MPDEREAIGLLALMLLQDSRRDARVDADGQLVLLPDQDRSRWDTRRDHRGRAARRPRLAARAGSARISCRRRSPSSTRAARTGRGSSGSTTSCWAISPTPIVALNRAVAIAERDGPEAGLALMDDLDLDGYHLFHAARADLLRRLDRRAEAAAAYRQALALTDSEVEREFLAQRLHNIKGPSL